MLNIAVLVSGGGTNLQAILDNPPSNGRVSVVISSKKGAYALERAKNHGVPGIELSRKEYADIASYCRALEAVLAPYKPDLIVLAGFIAVLDAEFCSKYENRIINVHPALIPSFCGKGYYGLKVHEKALEYGVKLTGATVHFVNAETDGGPIIFQKAVEVKNGDTPDVLQKRVMQEAEHILLPKAVKYFCDGKIHINGRNVIIEEE